MLEFKIINDKLTWERFLLASDQVNFLQSWAWGEFHRSLGHKIFRLGIYQSFRLVGLVLLIKIIARRGVYFEVPGGPIINWKDKAIIGQVFAYLKKLGLEQKISFIRIRPNICFKPEFNLIKAPMHLHAENTWVLDLNQSEAEIMAKMRKTTRYLIKKAIKLGVKIIISNNEHDIDILAKLQQDTVNRHHFIPFSREYFLNQFKAFKVDNTIKIFKAIYQGRVLSIAMIIFYGPEAIYHYSASSDEARQIPASYLVQWEAIKLAKKQHCRRYNFWGIAPNDNSRHRFYGVTIFKKGFGGQRLNYCPAYDLVVRKNYWLIYLFESLRKIFRRL